MSRARYEHKYLIENHKYLMIKKMIAPIFGQQQGDYHRYPVCSLYYDTPNLDYFYQKINGEYRHVKVRLRKYTRDFYDDSSYWLETKTKVKERIVKRRSELSVSDIPCPQDWPISQRLDLLVERAQYNISPSCFITYDREAFEFYYKSEKLRVTFDHNMSVTSPSGNIKRAMGILDVKNQHHVLMEIKYFEDSYPLFLKNLLAKISLKRIYFSKYAEGLNRLKNIL